MFTRRSWAKLTLLSMAAVQLHASLPMDILAPPASAATQTFTYNDIYSGISNPGVDGANQLLRGDLATAAKACEILTNGNRPMPTDFGKLNAYDSPWGCYGKTHHYWDTASSSWKTESACRSDGVSYAFLRELTCSDPISGQPSPAEPLQASDTTTLTSSQIYPYYQSNPPQINFNGQVSAVSDIHTANMICEDVTGGEYPYAYWMLGIAYWGCNDQALYMMNANGTAWVNAGNVCNGDATGLEYTHFIDLGFKCAKSVIPACQDGLDNDGDGQTDYPNDPGCTSADDSSETNPNVQCDDGRDNDGDGQVDYPNDPQCSNLTDNREMTDATQTLCRYADGTLFDGTWSYNDDGAGNDWSVTCRNGVFTSWCTQPSLTRGPHPGVYACNEVQSHTVCQYPNGTPFDGTWSYNDDGAGNDWSVTCRNGEMTAWCVQPGALRGPNPGVYSCESAGTPTLCNYPNGTPFDGTWGYNDDGGGNDFEVVCRNGHLDVLCVTPQYGRGAHPGQYGCSAVTPTQCNDGQDNDGDGQTDYPDDPGCAGYNDTDEDGEPIGYTDQPPITTCDWLVGWTCDPEDFNQPLDVHVYDGPYGQGGTYLGMTVANVAREPGVAALCGGNADHGFTFAIPASLKDGTDHEYHAYAINIGSTSVNPLLELPITLNCAPTPVANLNISKTGPTTVAPGTTLSYSVTALNAGPDTATNVTIADVIPSGLTFNAGASSVNCVQNASSILCNNFSLTNGQSRQVDIAFDVPVGATCDSVITNTATVSASSNDPDPSDNTSAQVLTTVQCAPPDQADLNITKTGPATVAPGNTVTYSVTATNTGPDTANTVTITDPIPAGLTFNAGASDPSCVQNAGNILCNSFSLTNGQSRQVDIVFDVPAGAVCDSVITNTATVASLTNDPNTGNNASSAQTTVTCTPVDQADLTVIKNGPATITRGSVLAYTITATNNGPDLATSVLVTDPIPAGLTFNATISDSGCTEVAGNIECNSFSLTNGESRAFTVAFDMPYSATCSSTIQNFATVSSSTADPVSGNNQSNVVQTTVDCTQTIADIEAHKTGPVSVALGETFMYQISVTNNGPDPVNNFLVTDLIQNGSTLNSTLSDPYCVLNGNNLECMDQTLTLTLNMGETYTFDVYFDFPVDSQLCDWTFYNDAYVQDSVAYDYNLSNNSSENVTTTVTCLPQCNDGIDNDNDGAIDYPADFGCSDANDDDESNPLAECQDGIDNDSNGFTDYPNDPGCASEQDDDESGFNPAVEADLTLFKSGVNQIERGNNLLYTVTAVNYGPDTATGIIITDVLPAGLTFNAALSDIECSAIGSTVTCDVGTLAAYSSNSYWIVATVTNAVACDSVVQNNADISASTNDPNPGNNQSSTVSTTVTCTSVPECSDGIDNDGDGAVDWPNDFSCSDANDNNESSPLAQCQDGIDNDSDTDTDWPADADCNSEQDNDESGILPEADLSIQKTGTSSIASGNTLVYTVTVTNNGPDTSTGVTITDPIPVGLVFNAGSSDPSCAQNGTSILCNNATLGSGQTLIVDIAFDISSSVACNSTIQEITYVSSLTNDPDFSNNQSNVVLTTVTCTECSDGIDNDGDGATDWPNDFSCSDANDDNENDPLAQCQDGIDNDSNGFIDYPNDLGCASEQDDDESGFNPAEEADLGIVKSAVSNISSGGNLLYTITAINYGPDTATGVIVTDVLPTGLVFNSVLSDTECNASGSTVLCDIGTLSGSTSETLFIVSSVESAACNSVLQNTASISASTNDPDLGNNQSATVSTTVTCPQCSDGIDNDGDGAVDWPNDFSCSDANDNDESSPLAQCQDGIDNDLDGDTDFPADSDCSSLQDDDESGIAPDADLTIAKTGTSAVASGGLLVYTITATNNGPDTATGVVITDSIPLGLVFNAGSSDLSCSQSGTDILCTNAALGSGQTFVVDIAFDVTTGLACNAIVQNTASVTSSTNDPNPGDNQSTTVSTTVICPECSDGIDNDSDGATDWPNDFSCSDANDNDESSPLAQCQDGLDNDFDTFFDFPADPECASAQDDDESGIAPDADLTIAKTGTSSVASGGTLIYTVTATNNGPNTATGVTVTDQIPTGLVFNSGSSDISCSQSGTDILCTNAALGSGQTFIVDIAFDVTTGLACAAVIQNTASVTSLTNDPNLGDNQSATVSTTVTCPQCSDGIDNDGDGATDWPNDFSCSDANDDDESSPLAQCQDGIDNDLDGDTDFPADSDCSSMQDNDESGAVVPSSADLGIVKSAVVSINRGASLLYTITTINFSTDTATGVTVTDTLPADLTFDPLLSDGICSASGSDVTCDIDTLTGSTVSTIQIVSSVSTGATCGSILQNAASVSASTPDPDMTNNISATVSTTVLCPLVPECSDGVDNDGDGATDWPADFSCSSPNDDDESDPLSQCQDGLDNDSDGQTDWPNDTGCYSAQDNNELPNTADLALTLTGAASVMRGDQITYTVSTVNNGPDSVTGAFTVDPIPNGMSFVSSTNSDCAVLGGVLYCNSINLIATGSTMDFDITFDTDGPIVCDRNIQNRVTIYGSNDPDTSNNADEVWTNVFCPFIPDISITKTDGLTDVLRGDTVAYAIIATNSSTGTMYNLSIQDILPSDVTFVSASDTGSYDSATHTYTWGGFTLAAGGTTTRTLTGTVNLTANSGALLTNTGVLTDGIRTETVQDLTTVAYIPAAQCNDGIDNDGDGLTDYPNDPGCASSGDDDEQRPDVECDDGIDNDNDGGIDYRVGAGGDTQCVSPDDPWEGDRNVIVTITDSEDPVAPGDAYYYTITVWNNDENPQNNMDLRFYLDDDIEFLDVSGGGTYNNNDGYVRWSDVDLAGDATVSFTVNVRARNDVDVGTILNTYATIDGTSMDDETTRVDSETPEFDDVSISITDDKDPVMPGDLLEYIIRVTNHTPNGITIDVRAFLDENTAFMDATDGGEWDEDGIASLTEAIKHSLVPTAFAQSGGGGTVIWENLYISSNDTETIRLTVRVLSSAYEDERLRLRVRAEDVEAIEYTLVGDNCVGPGCIPGIEPDGTGIITIDKEADRSDVLPGSTLSYTLTLRNLSDGFAKGLIVEDHFTAGSLTVEDPSGGISIANGVRWQIPSMGPAETRVIRYRVRVGSNMRNGQVITNDVRVEGFGFNRIATDSTQVNVISDGPVTGGLGFANSAGSANTYLRYLNPAKAANPSIPFIIWTTIITMGMSLGGILGKRALL